MKWIFLLINLGLSFNQTTFASPLPIYPAEIIARELISNLQTVKDFGHVGVTTAPYIWEDAYLVIEVLNNDNNTSVPVIQTNPIIDFKYRSVYWGSRFGISDRGGHALRILREANFQKDMGCATYTMGFIYYPNKGGYDSFGHPQPYYCGQFRCDTFINYIFHWGGYDLPDYTPPGQNRYTTPKRVFLAFPNGNGDGPFSMKSPNTNKQNFRLQHLSASQLNKLPLNMFQQRITNSSYTDENELDLNLKLAQNEAIDYQKRILILDKLGFTNKKKYIFDMINIYKQTDNKNIKLKNQVVTSIQNLYQRLLFNKKDSNEKKELKDFFKTLIQDNKVEVLQANIATRGLISLSSSSEINENLGYINSQINRLHPKFQLGLKIELVNNSKEFEIIYIPEILELLKSQSSADLDDSFNMFMINRLAHAGINDLAPSSKQQIAEYLVSIQDKYTSLSDKTHDNQLTMFSYGKWLESSALMNSNSFEEAGNFINNFLANKTNKEKISYVVGLSSNKYLKKAFSEELILRDFKEKNMNWYKNSVGIENENI